MSKKEIDEFFKSNGDEIINMRRQGMMVKEICTLYNDKVSVWIAEYRVGYK